MNDYPRAQDPDQDDAPALRAGDGQPDPRIIRAYSGTDGEGRYDWNDPAPGDGQ